MGSIVHRHGAFRAEHASLYGSIQGHAVVDAGQSLAWIPAIPRRFLSSTIKLQEENLESDNNPCMQR